MVMIAAYEDVKNKLLKRTNPATKGAKVSFFGFPDQPDFPHATLNEHVAGGHHSRAHFHKVDQFQVVVDGSFKIGRHAVTPYSIHFARAYTAYGPLVSEGPGFTFLVMRARRDSGPQHLPDATEQLKSVPGRKPWQVSAPVHFPDESARGSLADVTVQPVGAVRDDHGLAAYTLILRPDACTSAPDVGRGAGQYVLVVKGSLLHDGKEHRALALVFVKPQEAPYRIQAGPQGLDAIILNFPVPQTSLRAAAAPITVKGTKRWRCELCAFEYDEARGMPEEGIAPGTRWEDVPDSWNCPDCSATKSDFRMAEVALA